ncbi:hypothetical protein EXIGLDRAFT_752973 [Exidia glandulosa HHB12029]|uniref:Mid2 domain-containing protein n=1 Tax=Exidia glandulosa HHB12029 TaxID=1314781 RepID=A0A165E5F1_EXIGL|nr:hypothetical protein EXIGLDRAFT_752973 [Exidia glandulosa HHB12029]
MFPFALFVTFALGVGVSAISHTTCKNASVTWYDDDQGLNPCKQYETIRRYCDSSYEVPILNVTAPVDRCNSQVATVFTGSGLKRWRLFSLPEVVQQAVCRNGPHLEKALYGLFWVSGSWFLEYTRQTIELDEVAGNSDPGKCSTTPTSAVPTLSLLSSNILAPDTSTSSSTVKPTSTSSQESVPSQSPARVNISTVVGACIGGAALAISIAGLIACLLLRKRRQDNRETAPKSREMATGPPPSRMVPTGKQSRGAAFYFLPSTIAALSDRTRSRYPETPSGPSVVDSKYTM